jgi:hypothetical protein
MLSKTCGLTGGVFTEGLLGKVVELSGLNITLDLAVPRRPVLFQEPVTKLRKLIQGERLDLLLDPLDLAHGARRDSRIPAGPPLSGL